MPFLLIWGSPQTRAEAGLNQDFGIPIWSDNSLWDDSAWSTASRLGLGSTKGRDGNETYRAGFGGKTSVLGSPLYAIDLYPRDGKVARIILGFVNEADLYSSKNYSPNEFQKLKKETFNQLRIRLTKRLGRPSGEDRTLYWQWLAHTLQLQNKEKALLLSIIPGTIDPTSTQSPSLDIDPKRASTPPQSYVRRSSNGDVVISGIPKISQGNRQYCVPATWEKVLRHYGLGYNVYDLAGEGETSVSGSFFTLFTSRMKGMLAPKGYKVSYLRFYPDDIKSLKGYIDKGLPLIWSMDAQNLPFWVLRNRRRRKTLPESPIFSKLKRTPAPHAILIIGYNQRANEIALSDSTELGSGEGAIWIHAQEAATAHFRQIQLLSVTPPGRSSGKAFLKAKWY